MRSVFLFSLLYHQFLYNHWMTAISSQTYLNSPILKQRNHLWPHFPSIITTLKTDLDFLSLLPLTYVNADARFPSIPCIHKHPQRSTPSENWWSVIRINFLISILAWVGLPVSEEGPWGVLERATLWVCGGLRTEGEAGVKCLEQRLVHSMGSSNSICYLV